MWFARKTGRLARNTQRQPKTGLKCQISAFNLFQPERVIHDIEKRFSKKAIR